MNKFVFLIVALFWLLICFISFVLLINVPFELLINRPGPITSLADLRGPGSWYELLMLISFPRIVYSFIFAIGLYFLYTKIVVISSNSTKNIKTLFLVVTTLLFFAAIFPRKTLNVVFLNPPETKRAIFHYEQGQLGGGLGVEWEKDRAEAIFFTDANLSELSNYYESLNAVEADLTQMKKDILQTQDMYEFYELKNGTSFSIDIGYNYPAKYAMFFHKE